jgi:hypothetical protein
MSNYKIIGADLMEYGPASAEQIHQWIAEGRVNAETKLQAEGTAEWRPLAETPEFAETSSGTAPPAAAGFLHTCCEHCSGPIEFPEHGLETEISCPHCGTPIRLRNGLSPRAGGPPPRKAKSVPTREVSAVTRMKVAEFLSAGAPEKEESSIPFYLLLGAGFLLLVLYCYWRGWINEFVDLVPFLAAGGILAGFLFAAHFDWRRDKKRTEAFANLASRFGMQFLGQAPVGFKLNLFTLGHDSQARNVMKGEIDGLTVSLFDYTYVTGSGKSRCEHRQTVVGLSLPTVSLPPFILMPENIFYRIASALGWHDIDFPEAPNFSKRFLLRGAQEHAIRAAFNPGVLDFFERHPGRSAEGCGRQLIYYRAGRLQPPAEIRAFLKQGCELGKLLDGSPAAITKVVRIEDYR